MPLIEVLAPALARLVGVIYLKEYDAERLFLAEFHQLHVLVLEFDLLGEQLGRYGI